MFKTAMIATLAISVTGITLLAAACSRAVPTASATADNHESTAIAPATGDEGIRRIVKIVVAGEGFSPSTVNIKRGEQVILEFTRLTDQTCATSVTLPEIHLTKDLPLNQPVQIHIPTDTARTLTFSCAMGMLKGTLVIS
jgi:plastocyanin domain-containing protein